MTNIVIVIQDECGKTCYCEEYTLFKQRCSLLSICSREKTTPGKRCATDPAKIMGSLNELTNLTSPSSKREAIYCKSKHPARPTSSDDTQDATVTALEGSHSCHDCKESDDKRETSRRSFISDSLTGRAANRTVLRRRTLSSSRPTVGIMARKEYQVQKGVECPCEPTYRDTKRTRVAASFRPESYNITRNGSNIVNTGTASLALDLYPRTIGRRRPRKSKDYMPLSLEILAPMRALRSLKITGMTRSYQRQIWRAVWLNPELEYLELEMAESPVCRTRPSRFRRSNLCNKGFHRPIKPIQDGWSLQFCNEASGIYHGDNGKGILERRIGTGAYLDILSIKLGRDDAVRVLAQCSPLPERLPIKSLVLSGFAVDDNAFFHCFDFEKLRNIEFRDRCVSLGLALPIYMRGSVQVTWPSDWTKNRHRGHLTIERASWGHNVRPDEIKLIDIKPRNRPSTKIIEPDVASRNVESIPPQLRPGSILGSPEQSPNSSNCEMPLHPRNLCELDKERKNGFHEASGQHSPTGYICAWSHFNSSVKHASDSSIRVNSAGRKSLEHLLSRSELFLPSLCRS